MGKKLTQQEVIKQLQKIHNNKYDYSLVEYKNDSEKIKIICKEHGVFEQQVACHKRQKQGCPKCGRIQIGKKQQITREQFIDKIEKIFGKNKFDYSKLEYKGAHIDISLICKNCNNIESKPPTVWYKGYGCLKCQIRRPNPKLITKEQFLEKVIKIHNGKYDYSNINFIDLHSKIEIICNKHGSFSQSPEVHLYGKSGCPRCKTSKGEEEIAIWLNNKNIKFIYQYQVKINNSNHYFDFYLPKHNIIIEFNGLQHYKPIKFFGGEEGFENLKLRDKTKEKYCFDNKINFHIINYKEKDNINIILNKLINDKSKL